MKKLILLCSCLLIGFGSVRAETYYSAYSPYGNYQTNPILESDIIHVEKERRYQWYHLDKIYGNYVSKSRIPDDFPFLETNDFQLQSWSEWQNGSEQNDPDWIYDARSLYQSQKVKPIRAIHFSDVQGSDDYFKITEIEVLIDDVKVPYVMPCVNCASDVETNLQNGVIDENPVEIPNHSYYRLYLGDWYDLSKLKIRLYFKTEKKESVQFLMQVNNYYSLEFHDFTSDFVQKELSIGTQMVEFSGVNLSLSHPELETPIVSLNPPTENGRYVITEIPQYRKREKWYRSYQEKRTYLADYRKDGDDYYCVRDDTKYQDFYRSQIRDKVVLKDFFVITNPNMKLEDWILESSGPVKIESQIDFSKNGTYSVIFKTPLGSFEKTLLISILENDTKPYQEQILFLETEIERFKNMVIKLENQYSETEQQNQNLQNEIDAYLEKIAEYTEKVSELNHTIEELVIEREKLLKTHQAEIAHLKQLLEESETEKTLLQNQLRAYPNCKEGNSLKNPVLDLNQHRGWNNWITVLLFLSILVLLWSFFYFRKKKSN